MPELPAWLADLARQFPIVVLVLVAVWHVAKLYIKAQAERLGRKSVILRHGYASRERPHVSGSSSTKRLSRL